MAAERRLPSGLRLGTLLRVAAALGAAPAEVLPVLAVRPRSGLLWERGVFSVKGLAGNRSAARTRRSGE